MESAVKTTLNLNDTLLTEAKALAARERVSLTRLIEEGLQWRLRTRKIDSTPAASVTIPVYQGQGGLAPGLSGLSNQKLLDAADHDT